MTRVLAFLSAVLWVAGLTFAEAGASLGPSSQWWRDPVDAAGQLCTSFPELDMTAQVAADELILSGPVRKPEWRTALRISHVGRPDHLRTWHADRRIIRNDTLVWSGAIGRAEYAATTDGLRQNFIIPERIPGSGTLVVELDVRTSLCMELEGPDGVAFRSANGDLAHAYRGLSVWDACGTPLRAWMSITPDAASIQLHVDDEGARHPITIDPVSTTADRILSPSVGGNFGWSVANAGDLNGDGYSDVAVGAYTAANPEVNEGLVYVYYGSSAGIPAAPALILQPDKASSNFGISVDGAGDVNNDGYSDLIVGASTWDNNAATLKEGGAFIYHGSAAGLNPVPAVILQSNATDKYLGYSVAGLGDINGDGYSDVGAGGYLAAYGQTNEGVAWIYLGSATGVNPVPRHQLERNQGAAQFGGCVAAAGDVNGDGFNDVIIGAHKFELTPGCPTINTCDDGGIFVYHGSANALGAGANPNPTTIFNTVPYSIKNGWAVNTAGDVNGDGYSDIIIGDWRDQIGAETNEGVAFVYHGSAAGVVTVPATTIQNNQANSFLGRSVSTAGDVNGDGYADVLVGSTLFSNGQNQEGATFLHLGSPTGVSSSAFFRFETNIINAQMGESVSTAGDVNGDGYSDIIAGVNNQTGGGAAYIYHGGPSNVAATPAFTRSSGQANALLGSAVANLGDVNGDGYSDAAFGAPSGSNGQAGEGLVYVHYGSITGLALAPSLTLEANVAGAAFGTSVASAGDVNGDGYADVVVGAPQSGGIGRGYVYLGGAGGLSNAPSLVVDGTPGSLFGASVFKGGDMNADGFSEVLFGAPGIETVYMHLGDVSGLWPVPEMTYTAPVAGGAYGSSVCTAGDVNGDGMSDIIIGAPDLSNGQVLEGAAYVYLGTLFIFSNTPQFSIEGNAANYRLGASVAGVGDVNGDGYYEIITGAPGASLGEAGEGAAFVFYGSGVGTVFAGVSTIQANLAGAALGTSVAEAGDVNGDGYADICIGAPDHSNGQANEGRIWVVLGAPAGLGTNTTVEINDPGDRLGAAVAGGGDVDGDGYSDVLGGAPNAAPALANEGTVHLFRGNNGLSLNRLSRQYLTDLVSPLSTNSADFMDQFFFGIGHRARSWIQRTTAKLRWEVVHEGQPFSGVPITNSVAFIGNSVAATDLGLAGFQIRELVAKAPGYFRYKWRARVEYPMNKMIDGQRFSRWFYGYASAVGDIGILPIELADLSGEVLIEGNRIDWTVTSAADRAYYLVERSTDNTHFTTLGSVASDPSVSSTGRYSFLDNAAPDGLAYYRLRMVARDGTESRSQVIELRRELRRLSAYPVPVDLELRWSGPVVVGQRVVVRDALGRVVLDRAVNANSLGADLIGPLATGSYTLQLLDPSGAISGRASFIKN